MPPAPTQPPLTQEIPGPPASHPGPQLLIAWEPFWPVFLGNLKDTLLRREPPPLAVTSRPAPFWPDVFVHRPLPRREFLQSGIIHLGVLVLIISTGHLWFGSRPKLLDQYTHTTITYYSLSEELPPLPPSPAPKPRQPRKGEPELAKQHVISVPVNADNSTQTIVNPMHPNVVREEVPLPNMMVWTEVPAPPVAALKSQITLPRIAPTVVPPAPDVSRLRAQSQLKMSPQDAVEAQPSLDDLKTSPADLTLAHAPDVVGPAPQIALPLRRSSAALGAPHEAVPPPPAVGAPGNGPRPNGAGQLLALSVRPQPPAAEIKIPDGSRSGVFEAGPAGRAGAPGTPNITGSGGAAENGTGNAPGNAPGAGNGSGNSASPLAGISVTGGSGRPPTGSVVATVPPALPPRATPATTAVVPALPRIDRQPVPVYPPPGGKGEDRKLENQVFGTRRSYSMQLNMANLTSSGGSWIIRFAELKESKDQGELSTPTVMQKVDPAYPPDLIKEQVEGVVTLYAVIHADGSVGEVRLLQGLHERLDENAIKALLRWHFRPAMKNGQPVDLEAVVSVPFKARRLTGF